MNNVVHKKDLLYPELSYKIIGILMKVNGTLGYGHKEKYYENAAAVAFKNESIKHSQQLYMPLIFEKEKIGSYYLDFLIEDKIVLELKQGNSFSKSDIEQVYTYLKSYKLKLGILARFSSNGLMFKRIVNIN